MLVSTHSPPQSTVEAGQSQLEDRQVRGAAQGVPHAPQFIASKRVSTQVPPQSMIAGINGSQTQLPAPQRRPDRHARPQPPQCEALVSVFTHVPEHSVVPDGQVQTPSMHMLSPHANLVRHGSPTFPTQESPSHRPLQQLLALSRVQKPPAVVQLRVEHIPEMQLPSQHSRVDPHALPVGVHTPESVSPPPESIGAPASTDPASTEPASSPPPDPSRPPESIGRPASRKLPASMRRPGPSSLHAATPATQIATQPQVPKALISRRYREASQNENGAPDRSSAPFHVLRRRGQDRKQTPIDPPHMTPRRHPV